MLAIVVHENMKLGKVKTKISDKIYERIVALFLLPYNISSSYKRTVNLRNRYE